MPSRPRSDALLTFRSSATPCATPFLTRTTRPDAFSSTRKSFGPRKASEVGWLSPETTVRTPRFGTVIDGAADCEETPSASCTELFEGNGSCSSALTVVVVLKTPVLDVRTRKSTAADCPAGSAPKEQSYWAFGAPGLSAQRSPFAPGTKNEKPAGM